MPPRPLPWTDIFKLSQIHGQTFASLIVHTSAMWSEPSLYVRNLAKGIRAEVALQGLVVFGYAACLNLDSGRWR